jgi:hypothetical protein
MHGIVFGCIIDAMVMQMATPKTGENGMRVLINKSYHETNEGKEYVRWNVTSASGYVYETFHLKRDAVEWCKQNGWAVVK